MRSYILFVSPCAVWTPSPLPPIEMHTNEEPDTRGVSLHGLALAELPHDPIKFQTRINRNSQHLTKTRRDQRLRPQTASVYGEQIVLEEGFCSLVAVTTSGSTLVDEMEMMAPSSDTSSPPFSTSSPPSSIFSPLYQCVQGIEAVWFDP